MVSCPFCSAIYLVLTNPKLHNSFLDDFKFFSSYLYVGAKLYA